MSHHAVIQLGEGFLHPDCLTSKETVLDSPRLCAFTAKLRDSTFGRVFLPQGRGLDLLICTWMQQKGIALPTIPPSSGETLGRASLAASTASTETVHSAGQRIGGSTRANILGPPLSNPTIGRRSLPIPTKNPMRLSGSLFLQTVYGRQTKNPSANKDVIPLIPPGHPNSNLA